MHRKITSWWREAGERGTKQPYQPDKPVLYIVPVTSILRRLPLIPAGDHCTIPAALRGTSFSWKTAMRKALLHQLEGHVLAQ
jgi:hypothetical protein